MSTEHLLATITALSHEFGTPDHVKGGGGNTSAKDDSTVYVKPSGITLRDMRPEDFLPLDRARVAGLMTARFPEDVRAREAAVVEFMAGTIRPGHDGRPSVEAPLHNSFTARYVVHTHPTLVGGLVCGRNGEAVAREMFPDALWLDPIEPGYLLSLRVGECLAEARAGGGGEPAVVFLANHGMFVAHDDPAEIRRLYADIMGKVTAAVAAVGLAGEPERGPDPTPADAAAAAAVFREALGGEAEAFTASGRFALPGGPLSPDHIVYSRSRFYEGPLDAAAIRRFRDDSGIIPRVARVGDMVLGLGRTRKAAALALEFAWDGAMVERYAGAFGGVAYLEPRLADFIENWEVEKFRRQVST
ncbi:MAG: class II aldolase/adducin family protein [Planctomycetaceae bacterium]|nr:class II aldolase/adducin family protein [Planctomycetaceae bacterium]